MHGFIFPQTATNANKSKRASVLNSKKASKPVDVAQSKNIMDSLINELDQNDVDDLDEQDQAFAPNEQVVNDQG